MNRLLPCCALLLGAVSAAAQTGTITGVVINATTHAPVEGATISVVGTSFTTLSSETGTFAILGIPARTYSVSAHRFGLSTVELTGVDVQAGRTRTLTFSLRESTSDSTERQAFVPDLLDGGIGPTAITLSRDQLVSLPFLTLSSALGASGGYLNLPRSAATLSRAEVNRGITSLGTVRGGRPEATQYLLDGIAVNNPVFGALPLLIEPLGAAGVTLSPAHVDAEYGGALSGVVNQAIRHGDARMNGAFEYQTTGVANKLGDAVSGASGSYGARGFVSGPIPFTNDAVHFSLAGHVLGEHASVRNLNGGPWSGRGHLDDDQIVGKLTYDVRPTVMLSLAFVGRRRIGDGVDASIVTADTVAQPVVRDDGRFLVLRAQKRLLHGSLSMSVASNSGDRETCSIWQGVCIADRIARVPQGSELPGFGVPPNHMPYAISGQFFGGEKYRTRALRADWVTRASEHHEVQLGVYAAKHNIEYQDAIAYAWEQGVVKITKDAYRTRPTEFASYVQDAMHFDLITLHLGARFEYGNTGGTAFNNPLNPTNGTTAHEVCDGKAPGLSDTPFRYGSYTGIVACLNAPAGDNGIPFLLDSATKLAQRDDTHPARSRGSFAPRIGLSFPLTEASGMFLNVGRYSRQPLYHHVYRNTGMGSRAGLGVEGDGMCVYYRARPGSTECATNMGLDPRLAEFVGNPGLSFEMADEVEAGFTSGAGREHSIDASVFWNTQSHLPSLHTKELTPDIGQTYTGLQRGEIRTVLSDGSSATLGASVTLRRRRQGALAYTINYTWLRTDEIRAAPDLVAEALSQRRFIFDGENWTTTGIDFNDALERSSPRARSHTVSATFSWQWTQQIPKTLPSLGAVFLRNSRTTAAVSVATGNHNESTTPAACAPGLNTDPCAAFEQGITGTGVIANLQYIRSLTTTGTRFAVIARVQNLFDVNDGSGTVFYRAARVNGRLERFTERVSLRRVFTGMSVAF